MISPYSFRSESTNKNSHKLLSEDFVFDYFDVIKSGFFSWHDLQALEMAAFQMNQSNLLSFFL